MHTLLVGVGQEIITPPLGTMMMGYSPMRPALSVHDDLHVTAFAFQCGDTQVLLLSADLCNIAFPQSEIRAAITAASGVPEEHIVISCTHTHSGPTAQNTELGAAYVRSVFIPQAAAAAKTAVERLRPAQMGIGTTGSDVAVNRRQIDEDGTILLGQNPHGSWDPTMTVLAFREPDGTPIGSILQYGCHNTASGKNDEVSRDWCGVAVDRLQTLTGGIAAFINGCGGDCGPRLPNGGTTGDVTMAQELGGKAGIDAMRAYNAIRQWQSVPVKVLHAEIPLPLADIETPEQLQAKIDAMGDPTALKGVDRNTYRHLTERLEYLRQGNIPPKTRSITVTFFALGELAICPLPFEVFSIITLRIKEGSPFLHTLVPGYSNGSLSYFPSMDQIIRGGYEIEMFQSNNIVPFADNAEQALVSGSLKLLRELYAM